MSLRLLYLPAFLLSVLLTPVATLIALVATVYGQIHKILVRIKLKDKDVLFVSATDCTFLQDTSENKAIINTLLTLLGPMDIVKYRQRIMERLVTAKGPRKPEKRLFPKMSSYPSRVMSRYVWLPVRDLDIKDYVYVHSEQSPNDKAGLERIIGELCSNQFPADKAGWQFIIISPSEGDPNYGKQHYMVFRMHHSIADGVSLIRLLLNRLVDDVPMVSHTQRHVSNSCVMKTIRAVFEGPAYAISQIVSRTDSNLIHGPRLSGSKLFSWSEPVDLQLIKRIKNSTGTTVNDVFMACLASSLREYFRRHDADVPRDLRSYFPVNLRSSSDEIRLDNQFATVFLDLPLTEDDSLVMLDAVKIRMRRLKDSIEPVVSNYLMTYYLNYLPGWLTQAAFDREASKCTLVMSNTPGPQQKLRFAGNTIDSLMFWALAKANIGLTASIFSYCGSVYIGFATDRNTISNPRVLVDEFVSQINILAAALKLE